MDTVDLLADLLARLPDDELAELARLAERKAMRLERSVSNLDRTWAPVLGLVATCAESALLARQGAHV